MRPCEIYGFFRDGKPTSDLFMRSPTRWKILAADMGATYCLWTADMADTLIREQHPQFLDMYKDVRYLIMRADIGRVAILHHFGGLYSDLDVFPVRTEYKQAKLGVAIQKAPSDKGSHCYEMELLVVAKDNPVLLEWLTHMQREIASKAFDCPVSFWSSAKMRYI